jgi:hypothetical protein
MVRIILVFLNNEQYTTFVSEPLTDLRCAPRQYVRIFAFYYLINSFLFIITCKLTVESLIDKRVYNLNMFFFYHYYWHMNVINPLKEK